MADSLLDHIKELRYRFISIAVVVLLMTIVAFIGFDTFIALFSLPFQNLPSITTDQLFVHSLFEGFATKMKFSLLFGLVLAFPFCLFHILRFIFPGLRRTEKVTLTLSLFFGSLLAGTSCYLVYMYLLPFSITLLTSSQFIPEGVGLVLNYKQNIFYIFNVLLGSMVLFQFPIILFFLMKIGVVKRKSLVSKGRYVIVLSFVLSALVTPPDIVSQVGFALPLILLFYLTILIAKIFKVGSEPCLD